MTGRSPRPQALSLTLRHAPAATQASHCAKVTSVLPTANGFAIVTSCWGPSVGKRSASVAGEPIVKRPAGTTIIVGQPLAHSANSEPGFDAFSVSCSAVRTDGPMYGAPVARFVLLRMRRRDASRTARRRR